MSEIRNADVLNGLDEIALYMGLSKQTILNYEAYHGLPLLRPVQRGIVYAYKSELEKWRRGELKK